jgi:hypothetical protein
VQRLLDGLNENGQPPPLPAPAQHQGVMTMEFHHDTCSLFSGTNLDTVEMGLVHDVEQEGSMIRVRLLLTDPMPLPVLN